MASIANSSCAIPPALLGFTIQLRISVFTGAFYNSVVVVFRVPKLKSLTFLIDILYFCICFTFSHFLFYLPIYFIHFGDFVAESLVRPGREPEDNTGLLGDAKLLLELESLAVCVYLLRAQQKRCRM